MANLHRRRGKGTPTDDALPSQAINPFSLDIVQVLDELEPLAAAGGQVIDWHTCDVFPERWVDLVVVLRCDHTLLWDRLEKRSASLRNYNLNCSRPGLTFCFRGYSLKKIQENNESEIMQTVLDDAKDSYAEEIVVELRSNSTEDLESNVQRIVSWIQNWRRDRDFSDNST